MKNEEAIEIDKKMAQDIAFAMGVLCVIPSEANQERCKEIGDYLDKAVSLPEPEKSCDTCGGSREVLRHCDECKAERGRHCKEPNCKVIPCPTCKLKEDAAEFVAKLKDKILLLQLYDAADSRSPDITYTEVFRLIAIIENMEAE